MFLFMDPPPFSLVEPKIWHSNKEKRKGYPNY